MGWGASLILMMLRDFIAQHIIWLIPIGFVVFAILSPGSALAVVKFLTQTRAGQFILGCLVTGFAVWFARGYIDDAANRTQAIAAARQAEQREKDLRKEAEARVAEIRRQAAASDRLAAEARARADATEAAFADYEIRMSDYEDDLAKRPAPAGVGAPCTLDDADVRSLRGAAGAFARKPAAAAAAGKLRPPGARP